MQLVEAAQEQGMDIDRLFAEALALGAVISPEAAAAAGIMLPDAVIVAQVRCFLVLLVVSSVAATALPCVRLLAPRRLPDAVTSAQARPLVVTVGSALFV